MKKSLLVLSVLGACLLVTSCGGEETSESNSITSEFESEVTSEVESMISERESVDESSSEEISSVQQLTVKEQLTLYLKTCIETQNYTIINEELTRFYLPNAFYCEDNYASPYGYAEDETGVFSYNISNGIIEYVSYLKDESENNIKGLYEYSYGNYSWIEKENYLINSFASVSMDNIELTRVKNSKVESYTVDFDALCCLLTEFHLQGFVAASVSGGVVTKTLRGTCTLSLIEGGFNISFYSSASYTTIEYQVKNIGSTEIPEITDYLENDGLQVGNLYTQIVSLFASERYKVTYGDGKVRYVAPNYIVDVDGENVGGYFISMSDLKTYSFTIINGDVVVGEATTDVNLYSYSVSSSFLSNFALEEDKLVVDNYLSLQNSSGYFTISGVVEGNYIGYAEITASIAKDENQQLLPSDCVVTFVGKEYDGNQGALLETTYTATYSEFSISVYEDIENYLNSLN